LIERAARSNCPVNGIVSPTVRYWDGVSLQSARGLSFSDALFVAYVFTSAVFPARAAAVKSLKVDEIIAPNKAIELTEYRTE
jgi:hypothetical protein